MKYQITHKTSYSYGEPADLCHNEARLSPRILARQHRHWHTIDIFPAPTSRRDRDDFFGNRVSYFSVERPHETLEIIASSLVEIVDPKNDLIIRDSTPWENVRVRVSSEIDPEFLAARQFTFDSPLIKASPELAAYAQPSFEKGRMILEGTEDLMRRIHEDFEFVSGFTTVSTPLEEVLQHRKGVCQDFAQLGVGCLRSLGLPARYISGYIETLPPPGQERLVGADATHAWFSVYDPAHGWIDFDPTNNQRPTHQHITAAWGRDYSDVAPIKGVMVASGDHFLEVSVDVEPQE